MDIKDYAQMMKYLTRPRDVIPDPSTMDQEPRIGFSKGADTSPVYNEKTGHIYKIGNRHGQFYSKTPPKNQFTAVKPLRSLEELQLVIDKAPLLEIDGKFFEQNPKDLEGRSEYSTKELISRKELEKKDSDGVKNRDKLKFKSTGKKRIEETNQGNITRRNKIIATQGSEIPIIGGKKINRAFSHVYPIIESAKPGTKTTTVIDADMNSKLIGYNRIGQKIAEDQEYLLKVKPEGYKQEILVNNAKAKKNVMNAIQDLGKDYKGQIGYFQVDPETESFKPKAGNYQMSFAGVEGKDEIYKDMTSKERQAFSKKISKEEKLNLVKQLNSTVAKGGSKGKAAAQVLAILTGTTVGASASDPSAGTSSIVKNAAIGGGAVATLGTKTGRKVLSNLLSAAGVPLSVGFNAIYGIDPESSLDRTILGAEAALAPMVVKDAIRVTDKIKNPLLKKVAQVATTINPKYALKAAKVLNPIGIASLAGEAVYNVGKLGYEDQQRFNALSPEEQAAERAEQEKFAFDIEGS